MGSFDSWTMGQQLSSDSMSDAVFQTFQTTLRLIPGEYRVCSLLAATRVPMAEAVQSLPPAASQIKFLVDGEWRTAGDWPTATDSMGNLENILVVE